VCVCVRVRVRVCVCVVGGITRSRDGSNSHTVIF
jgi:hypothetical protein